jgi:hypothetical protein
VAERELQDLAGDVDLEEQQSIEAMAQCQIDGMRQVTTDMEMETDDDIEGWIDEMMLLSPLSMSKSREIFAQSNSFW